MYKWIFGAATLLALTALPALAQDTPITTISTPPDPTTVQFTPFVDGLWRPLFITAAPGGDALYIVEQGGKIKRVAAEGGEPSVFLDLSSLVSSSANGDGYSEQGLLGLAFHPDFATNGTFFVDYTDKNGNTVIARYTVSESDPTTADPASAAVILTQDQPFANHNGGHMAFGPDGYLYIAFGDGGSANDPERNAQNLQTLLGKILRIDVNDPAGYKIPADNPFVGGQGLPEIWAYGVRNPWRFSFDRATGDLYIGDVGQNVIEEVDFQPADSKGGENYGWSGYEADQVLNQDQVAENTVMPIATYNHSTANGCSISGGYVYRGQALPDLQSVYFYSDYCSGRIWATYRDASNTWQTMVFLESGHPVSSFGEDANGELFLVDYGGKIYRLEPAS
jgi:glucose/arabinose dehydrogenase